MKKRLLAVVFAVGILGAAPAAYAWDLCRCSTYAVSFWGNSGWVTDQWWSQHSWTCAGECHDYVAVANAYGFCTGHEGDGMSFWWGVTHGTSSHSNWESYTCGQF